MSPVSSTCDSVIADELESGTQKAKELKTKATARAAELEDMLKNAGAIRERELKQAQADLDQKKKAADQSSKKSKDSEMVRKIYGLLLCTRAEFMLYEHCCTASLCVLSADA